MVKNTFESPEGSAGGPGPGSWKFLTNHGHVLLAVAIDPDIRVQEVARSVGVTTRATLLILKDLEDAGYIHRERVGRRTHYTVDRGCRFRHPAAASHRVAELIAIFADDRTNIDTVAPVSTAS